MVFDFEKEKLVKELRSKKPKKVLVQLPEGIKQNVLEVLEIFEKENVEVIFSGETCWGGCSIAVQEAQALGVDLIVHFGHAPFVDVEFPAVYIEVKDILDLNPILQKSLNHLEKFKKIGFSYSIQHRHDAEKIKEFYKSNGKEIMFSKKQGRVAYEGHIVGCQYAGLKSIQSEVEAFVILGNRFHSTGAVIAVNKPVILLDVYNDEILDMSGMREKIIKQRYASIEKLKNAKNVGILVEIKPGQKFGTPELLIKTLKEQGKNPFVITMSEITPDKIMNFYYIDAFIELACPRIAVDDYAKYEKPILTFREALVALNKMSWEDFLEKGVV